MSNQTDQLWETLQRNGIVQGEQPQRGVSGSPWYVKALLAFSGWLAAIFILGFVGIAFEFVFRNSEVAGIVGVMMIGGSFALFRWSSNEFVEHLALAASMAGQVLTVYAIFEFADHHETVAWLLLVVLQVFLISIMPNFVHCVISSVIAATAFAMMLNEMNMSYLIGGAVMFGAASCWLNEFHWPHHMKKIRAMGYGSTLALIALQCTSLFGQRVFGQRFLDDNSFWDHPWLAEGIIGAVTVYVVARLLQRYRQPILGRLSITTLLATLLVCAVSVKVQGITVGLVIICLGFYNANRVLLGLGITSLLFSISSYYYLLETTLLNKSQSLLGVGLALLCVRWLMHRISARPNEKQHHA